MHIIPQSIHLLDTDSLQQHKFSATQSQSSQHGKHQSGSADGRRGTYRPVPLLEIPSESLTHITSFLDPASLFALGRTNKILHEHIADDNTWHKAFACRFLNERPERSASRQSVLLRRCEDSWKREYVLRCNIIRRWERSRNGTISHVPHYSPVMAMRLLADRSYGPALLSTSLQYGVIARSFPLSGKVLKGFISASEVFGIGNGNPNAEFTPNISSCALITEGWTARAVFGFVNGEVALASAVRVMESGRTANKVLRCRINEEHRGSVVDIVWDGLTFATAGLDGEVRVWDAKRMNCALVLKEQQALIPDPCVHVLSDLERGVVLATKKSGAIVVWAGLSFPDEVTQAEVFPSTLRITLPGSAADESKGPSCIFMNRSAPPGQIHLGVYFEGDMHFLRVNINLLSGQHEVIKFADGPLAPIQVIHPFFSTTKGIDRSVILTGDSLGHVSLFDWSSAPDPDHEEVPSFRRIDDSADGVGVSAIACNPYVIAIGTTRGTTKIYDTLTLCLLREFPSPVPRPNTSTTAVKQIIIERDLLLVAVGERILAWGAGPVRPHKSLTMAKKASAKGRNAKWHKRFELAQDISESRRAVEDAHTSERRSHERRRAHHAALAGLGLDEHEALQYVLMLSRDEAAQQNQMTQEESVFDADFDDVVNMSAPLSRPSSCSEDDERSSVDQSPVLRPASSQSSSLSDETSSLFPHSSQLEMTSPGTDRGIISATRYRSAPHLREDTEHFPAISSSVPSAVSSLPRASPSPPSTSWSSRLKVFKPGSSSSAAHGSADHIETTTMRRSVSGPSLLSETLRSYERGEASTAGPVSGDTGEEMDTDLKLAIELSLAEVLSLKNA